MHLRAFWQDLDVCSMLVCGSLCGNKAHLRGFGEAIGGDGAASSVLIDRTGFAGFNNASRVCDDSDDLGMFNDYSSLAIALESTGA
jgi:hypothetical protein